MARIHLTPQQEQHPLFMIKIPTKEYVDKKSFKFISVDITEGETYIDDRLYESKIVMAFAKETNNAVHYGILGLHQCFSGEKDIIRIQIVNNELTYVESKIASKPHITLIAYI